MFSLLALKRKYNKIPAFEITCRQLSVEIQAHLMSRSKMFLRKSCLSKNSGCHGCRVRAVLLGRRASQI